MAYFSTNLGQSGLIFSTGIVASPITMMNHARWRLTLSYGLIKRFKGQGRIISPAQSPAYYSPTASIQQAG
jgi:hypothetical protein